MRLKKGVHPLRLLSLLALLGLLTFWDPRFNWFVSFAAFAAVDRWRADERIGRNVARAARNSFVAAMLGLWAAGMVTGFRPEIRIGSLQIMMFLISLWLFFIANLAYYEQRGD